MKWQQILFITLCGVFSVGHVSATVFYVNVSNAVPISPFANWSTAATNIQDAVDASADGDFILVSNGVYKTGGRVVYGSLTNRVVINKAVTVQSVNGPTKTFILGFPVMGNFAVRCAYLTNNAALFGFTLTNGATRTAGDNYSERSGGGVWCESVSATVSNCVIVNGAASFLGGGTVSGTLLNCMLTNNSAGSCGGGALAGVLTNCVVTRNTAVFGGGTCSNILFGCKLTNNWATSSGGGAFSCILSNCFLYNNSATNGGGATYGALTGCTLTNNTAYNGGGACSNTLTLCKLISNLATNNGGGTFAATLTNCTLTKNIATGGGGGACLGKLSGCLLNLNNAYYGGGAFSNTLFNCTLMNSNQATLGGGAYGSTLNLCLLSNNVAGYGGGSAKGTLNNCLLLWNKSPNGSGSFGDVLNNCELCFNVSISSTGGSGGAANQSTLNNCTVVHNYISSFPIIGGAFDCRSTNCIVYYNDYCDDNGSQMSNCCLLKEIAAFATGYFTNSPLLLADNFHLQTNSPCIDAGVNTVASGSVDFDGRPRVVNGTVDIGATEFQSAAMEPFIVWLSQYALPNDGSADYSDADGDGMNNWQEWIAGTNPTNAASLLQLSSPSNSVSGVTVTWQSVGGVTYYLQSSTNLAAVPAFTSIQSNLVGQAGFTSYTDTNAIGEGPFFYRVGVQ
jgi:hypothetical protein